MKSFLEYLDEALTPVPGIDKGWEEKHSIPYKDKNTGEDKVLHGYLQFHHHGSGHYKITALTAINDGKPSVRTPKDAGGVPGSVRLAMAAKAKGTFNSFMAEHGHKINSIVAGGTGPKNRAIYRQLFNDHALQSGGRLKPNHFSNGAARLERTSPTTQVHSSGVVPQPPAHHDDMAPFRDRVYHGKSSGSGSSGRSSDRSTGSSGGSSGGFSDAMYGGKFAPSGIKGPSGPKKSDDTAGVLGASSAASSAGK